MPEVLIPAIKLTDLPGIFVDTDFEEVTYHHLLFEEHELLMAEGITVESMLPGKIAMDSLSPKSRAEIYALFPGRDMSGEDVSPAAPIPDGKMRKRFLRLLAGTDEPIAVGRLAGRTDPAPGSGIFPSKAPFGDGVPERP